MAGYILWNINARMINPVTHLKLDDAKWWLSNSKTFLVNSRIAKMRTHWVN
jgi:hypothetical protein